MPQLTQGTTLFSLIAIFAGLLVVSTMIRGRLGAPRYFRYVGAALFLLSISEILWFSITVWLFAFFSFVTLREFFSLVDIRIQDRWGILGAYAAIPFMSYFIHTDWYGMFIIAVPVYAFTAIPLLVAFGKGDSDGTVFSLGVIDLGLFLFVYCIGHLAYLAFFSAHLAIVFLLSAAFSDLVYRKLPTQRHLVNLATSAAGSFVLLSASSPWTDLPFTHAVGLGLVIPALALGGSFTLRVVEDDLRVSREQLEPGRGLLLDSLKAYLFPAPIVFHYLRWFLHWGDR